MFFLRKNSVVGLEIVLLQEFLAIPHLHIQQGVSDAEELECLGGHGRGDETKIVLLA